MKLLYFVPVMVLAAVPAPSLATILFHAGLGEPPPAALSGIPLTEFGFDERPLRVVVDSIPSPLGGDVGFMHPGGVVHGRVGLTWAMVDEDYLGDIYMFSTQAELMLTMPPETVAFRTSVASARDGFSVSMQIATDDGQLFHHWVPRYGLGAHWVGFSVSNPETEVIRSVRIFIHWGGAASIGRLAIARVPEPATLALLMFGWLTLRRRSAKRPTF